MPTCPVSHPDFHRLSICHRRSLCHFLLSLVDYAAHGSLPCVVPNGLTQTTKHTAWPTTYTKSHAKVLKRGNKNIDKVCENHCSHLILDIHVTQTLSRKRKKCMDICDLPNPNGDLLIVGREDGEPDPVLFTAAELCAEYDGAVLLLGRQETALHGEVRLTVIGDLYLLRAEVGRVHLSLHHLQLHR